VTPGRSGRPTTRTETPSAPAAPTLTPHTAPSLPTSAHSLLADSSTVPDPSPLARRQGKRAGRGRARRAWWSHVVARDRRCRPFLRLLEVPHACHRRPRSHLPKVRLPKHPSPPARRALPPPAHRRSPRHLNLRRRPPRSAPPPEHRPKRRSYQPRRCRGALRTFLEGQAGGFNADPNQTVADYLHTWPAAKTLVLKPTTMACYGDYVHNDLAPPSSASSWR
jgi:hypothetical protein